MTLPEVVMPRFLLRSVAQYALILCLVSANSGAATIYVDRANTSGPWDGTPEFPFATISDGSAAAGNDGEIRVAEGEYRENVRLTRGQLLVGGYDQDWAGSNPDEHVTAIISVSLIDPVVVLATRSIIDGFTLTSSDAYYSSAGILAEECQGFAVRSCRIGPVRGYGGIGPGVAVTGISIKRCSPGTLGARIERTVISGLTGGGGGPSPDIHWGDGEDGGAATGITVAESDNIEILQTVISNIAGGNGGAGSYSGHGGDGGLTIGIDSRSSTSLVIDGCVIERINGGHGGFRGGAAGMAIGALILDDPAPAVEDTVVRYCQGGLGGDLTFDNDPVAGGHAAGIAVVAADAPSLFNLLIYHITGGNCGLISDTATAAGGSVWGLIVHAPEPALNVSTISGCIGGRGAPGGGAIGLELKVQTTDFIRHLVITGVLGGAPSSGGAPGEGKGIYYKYSGGIIDYCNIWGNSVDFSGCEPGPACLSADPLLLDDGRCPPFFLAHSAAGQPADSPCIDAGAAEASEVFHGEERTTRTDGVGDSETVDLGFHAGAGVPLLAEYCSQPGVVSLSLPDSFDFKPYDWFALDVGLCRTDGTALRSHWLAAVIEVAGIYYIYTFGPLDLPPGLTTERLFQFAWPPGAQEPNDVSFYAALIDDAGTLYGQMMTLRL